MGEKKIDTAKQIMDEHICIKQTLKSLADRIDQQIKKEEFHDYRMEFIWQLREFRNHLLKHFDFEEDGGFMHTVLDDAPEVIRDVEALGKEHEHITGILDSILADLKKMELLEEPLFEKIKNRVKDLISTIQTHEQNENDLIQKVYYQEYGYPA